MNYKCSFIFLIYFYRPTKERGHLLSQRNSSSGSEYYTTSFVEPPLAKALHRKPIAMTGITSQVNNQQKCMLPPCTPIDGHRKQRQPTQSTSITPREPSESASPPIHVHREQGRPSQSASPPIHVHREQGRPSQSASPPTHVHREQGRLSQSASLTSHCHREQGRPSQSASPPSHGHREQGSSVSPLQQGNSKHNFSSQTVSPHSQVTILSPSQAQSKNSLSPLTQELTNPGGNSKYAQPTLCTLPGKQIPTHVPRSGNMVAQICPPKLDIVLLHCQLPPILMDVFPTSYRYNFKSFETNVSENIPPFTAVVQINVETEEKALQWIKDLENHTSITYRVTRGNKCKGKKIIFKTDRHCQHKRKKLSEKQKHCEKKRMSLSRNKKKDCPAHFTLKVHANRANPLPRDLSIHWEHNHSIQSAHALSFRPLGEEIIKNTSNKAIHRHQLYIYTN